MSSHKKQKQLRELFCELASPFILPGKADKLRACVMHKAGERFERLISHGDLSALFDMKESKQHIAGSTPCLSGCCTWKKSSFDEAFSPINDGYVIIPLDGSWLAVCQEHGTLNFYVPAQTAKNGR